MQLTPTEPRFWNALGVLLEVRGTYDEAEFAYRRALKLDTHFGPAHNNLGNLLQRKRLSQQRQSRDIVQEYRLAIEAEPSSPVPHHNFANFLVSRNRIDESLREFVKAVELAQQSNATFRARLFNDYGLALKRLNQLPKAMEQFQNAGKDKRERERERERERREKKRERKRKNIKKTQSISPTFETESSDPTFAAPSLNIGNIQLKQGQWEEAAASYQRALTKDPTMLKVSSSLFA
jgi:Tfp pilus assembly protein PilF